MKIKLAILEKDVSYLNRIVSVFSTKYADNFEIYSFTEEDTMYASLENNKIDVLAASDVFDIDISKLPKRCGFAYLVDTSGIETVRDQQAICKFQKAEQIYKQILSVFSDKTDSLSAFSAHSDNDTDVCIFSSVSGGSGASVMAVAAARYFAAQGKKTLYLNLEKFGNSDVFFSADGQYNFSDVIFSLKSKKSNLALKLESCVKCDKSGVYFYSQTQSALDMIEVTSEESIRLISELKGSAIYDYIIVDCDFSIKSDFLDVCRKAHSWIWVGDGSQISNDKVVKAYKALTIIENNQEFPLTSRIGIIYNKFSKATCQTITDVQINMIGGSPRFEHASVSQIVDQLSVSEMFNKIF